MKPYQSVFFILFLLGLAACGGAATPTPEPTAEVVAAAQASATNTSAPRPTDTAVSATSTFVPEPATATPVPTVETIVMIAGETVTATQESAAEVTPSATAGSGEATAAPPTTLAATAASEGTTAATAAATSTAASAPQPPAGSVPAPNDNNYPANDDRVGWENRIIVPQGFNVSYIGRIVDNPTSITFGPDGLLYIAAYSGEITGYSGNIYTMNENGNVNLHATGYAIPTGIAFRPGTNTLYVSSRVVNQNIDGEAKVSIVNGRDLITGLPCCYTFFHSANGIAFGADGMGYVGVGGRADHGEILDGSGRPDELHPLEASILRFNPDTGDVTVYARGFRNPYDIAWDGNGQLWATDNTPDYHPPERLHRVTPGGMHGYPYFDCDVCFSPPPDVTVIPPLVTFAPRSSPTGITAYRANQFPGYNNSLFVTLWSAFYGAQKVMHIGAGGSAPSNFATGFAAPIDITVGPDGSLYVADWATGIIFKISYTG